MLDEVFKDVRGYIFYVYVFCFIFPYVVCTSENKCYFTLKKKVFVFISSVRANLELSLLHKLSISVMVNWPSYICFVGQKTKT